MCYCSPQLKAHGSRVDVYTKREMLPWNFHIIKQVLLYHFIAQVCR